MAPSQRREPVAHRRRAVLRGAVAVSSVPVTWWSGCTPDMQKLRHVLWPGGDEPGMLQFLAGCAAAPAAR